MSNDAELIAYMLRLAELEQQGERSTIVIGPFTALTVVGAVQLCMRHPHISPVQRNLLLQLVDQFRPWFAGTPGEEIINQGNHPEWDR